MHIYGGELNWFSIYVPSLDNVVEAMRGLSSKSVHCDSTSLAWQRKSARSIPLYYNFYSTVS